MTLSGGNEISAPWKESFQAVKKAKSLPRRSVLGSFGSMKSLNKIIVVLADCLSPSPQTICFLYSIPTNFVLTILLLFLLRMDSI